MSTVSLYAASETLLSDMAEVLRLYMGGVTVLPNAPGGDMTIRHTEEIADGVRVVRVKDGECCEESRGSRGMRWWISACAAARQS